MKHEDPRPPSQVGGAHALDAPLGISPGADVTEVRSALDANHLATGTLTGLFIR